MIVRGKHPFTKWVVVGTTIFCIFAPKLILAYVAGGTAIRPDDFLMALALVFLLQRGELATTPVSHTLRYYLLYLTMALISALWGAANGYVPLTLALFFVFRPLQYLVFYYIGYYLARMEIPVEKILKAYLIFLCIIVPLQYMGVLPVASSFDRGRASGNTFGPYELAGVCGFILCYLGLHRRSKWAGWVAGIFIVLAASRIAGLATAAIILHNLRKRISVRMVRIAIATAAILLLTVSTIYFVSPNLIPGLSDLTLFARIQHSSSVNSFAEVKQIYNASPVYRNNVDYGMGVFRTSVALSIQRGAEDVSGLVRVFRWCTLVKSTLANVDTQLLGLGPSFATASVDGNYVRIFVETGFIGLFTFGLFAFHIFRSRRVSAEFKDFFFILLLTGIFIDIFTSYHVMICFWLWHGMETFEYRKMRSNPAVALRPTAAAI